MAADPHGFDGIATGSHLDSPALLDRESPRSGATEDVSPANGRDGILAWSIRLNRRHGQRHARITGSTRHDLQGLPAHRHT